ncbi:GntR family transcriptional regulator [Luteimonas viscosa]|uniref:GntR family transcriptional regulator n=1 Tax=Luteimonas viscosa TaxID=1132694 RepID=A0A5D4XNL6_9GAMM|nr:GntR family transcriptional regulator [Luteimonas viscosa]TYT26169.1 GntR family transcriptional regulator [Luteimonas viscosa]
MSETHSKSAFVYGQVIRDLQAGRYMPGQRVDPATLALEFQASTTPVRFALYRLVGEGLLEDHARSGLLVPLPNEVALRGLFDWMQRLLVMACDLVSEHRSPAPTMVAEPISIEDDVVNRTWQLFEAIARSIEHPSLRQAVRRANDQLAPVRRATQGLFDDAAEEYLELAQPWRRRDMANMKLALARYHERRMQLVPRIVARLTATADQHR